MRPALPGHEWWRDAVVYQVYVKSFADTDGDGIGDLDGITAHLDHVAALGVDAVWLNPCYPSPDHDGGYDVADYFHIADVYGGDDALDRLVAAAHERGLRLLLDVVPNHCSSEHAWFQAALRDRPGGPARGRFIFRDGRGPDGAEPPNNWISRFGGPAWTRVTDPDGTAGQWYLHLFDATQPDFDWTNPEVHAYFHDVLRYWLDRGIDGFRIDVAHGLVKAEDLPDVLDEDAPSPMTNQPGVHAVYEEWRRIADSYDAARQLVFVGEAWAPDNTAMAAYVAPGRLHQTFAFGLTQQEWSPAGFRRSVEESLAAIGDLVHADATDGEAPGVFAWTLNNHDIHRAVSRYGVLERLPGFWAQPDNARVRPRGVVDVQLGEARARAALLFLLGLPGSVYLYQGEELGLSEVIDLPDDVRQDPIWSRTEGRDPGRDGCRVPLPWVAGRPAFGFTPPGATPWLPQPESFADYAVDRQESDPDSTLGFYRQALAIRRRLFDPADELRFVDAPARDDVVAYARGRTIAVTVFGDKPFEAPSEWGEIAFASAPVVGHTLPGPASAWLEAAAPSSR